MNWLRDNILKVVIIVFILIIAIVVVVLISSSGGGNQNASDGYISLENKLQSAAISYVGEHQSLLPKTMDTIKKIQLDTLIEKGKIDKLYAVEDKSVVCTGHVEIEKISENSNEYRYTPYLKCGKYYVTKTISDYIIDKETNGGEFQRTADDGLYRDGEGYIFRGEYPENYIVLDSHLYRVVRIDENKQLELISSTSTKTRYVWDDRYNISIDRTFGINDFEKSRLYDSLNFLYENSTEEEGEVFFSELEKTYIIEHDFCIGKRNTDDTNFNSGAECTKKIPLKVGLISINEYNKASIDPNCKSIYDQSCTNYNYFLSLDGSNRMSFSTLTAVANNTFDVFKFIDGHVEPGSSHIPESLVPVIYISEKIIYKSGSGTFHDPYIVR